MGDDKKSRAHGDPFKAGAVVGLVVAFIGAVVLDLGWVAYLVLLGVAVVIGVVAITVRDRGEDTDRAP